MATRPTTTELATQMAALTEQVTAMAAQIAALSQVPPREAWGSHSLLDLHGKLANSFNPRNLASAMRFYEANIRKLVAVYYFVFGAIYISSGTAILTSVSSTVLIPATTLRLIIGAVYVAVGSGNLSCIMHATERYQKWMIIPTVMVAVLALLLSILSSTQPVNIVRSVIFWAAIITIHVTFGTTIAGRIGLRTFTLQLASASEAQEEQASTSQVTP